MPREVIRNIACLETVWHGDLHRPHTVRGVLQTASDLGRFRFAHLTCNTLEEFAYNLRGFRRRRSYSVLYLAFHGSPGMVELNGEDVALEDLAGMMGTGFRDRIVHFGTCGTLRTDHARVAEFLDQTGLSMVVGYEKDVDWIESASTDLLLFQWLQSYVNPRDLWAGFKKRYSGIVELTGMTAHTR